MFVSTHYAGEYLGMKFRNGEQWKKVFGPVFIYLNSASNNHISSLWHDAKSQVLIFVLNIATYEANLLIIWIADVH